MFREGCKVKIVNPNSIYYGFVGTIKSIKETPDKIYLVNLNDISNRQGVDTEVTIYKEEYIERVDILDGVVTLNDESVACKVELCSESFGNVVEIHLPKNKNISNAIHCVYFKYDLEV